MKMNGRIALGALASILLGVTSAQAQATRTFVSGVGDDVNPCSRTAPCKTFAGAISKTALNGEINCLDPGGYGAVTITKSITIDCHEIFASILNSGTNGININFDSFNPSTDLRKTVRLRNLNINGANTGLIGINIIGGSASAGSEVFIEDCLVDGDFGGTMRGINDTRAGGGELSISNTTVRNIGATGIVVLPASGSVRLDVTLDNVRVQNSNFGIAVSGRTKVMINRSVFSGNTQAGIEADGTSDMNVNSSVTSNNGIGIQVDGGATIRFSDTDIALNGTAITGTTSSFGNNRITGNIFPGTPPTAIPLE